MTKVEMPQCLPFRYRAVSSFPRNTEGISAKSSTTTATEKGGRPLFLWYAVIAAASNPSMTSTIASNGTGQDGVFWLLVN